MEFMLSNGEVISTSYPYAYLVHDYADVNLRIMSGQSWIDGLSEKALPEQARLMFRHANKVLDSALSRCAGCQLQRDRCDGAEYQRSCNLT